MRRTALEMKPARREKMAPCDVESGFIAKFAEQMKRVLWVKR
jgi:hypothetical protein